MTTKRTNQRKDFTQVALSVVQQVTGEVVSPVPSMKPVGGRKNQSLDCASPLKKSAKKKP
jgi:hypothetical protein